MNVNDPFSNFLIPASDPFNTSLPEILNRVPAGFPSPADDYMENSLDLNEHLIRNKAASFYIRVAGDSMNGAGIMSGDILLVDRSVDPAHNKIVVAIVDSEMTVKRLRYRQDRVFLVSENPEFRPIEITSHMDCRIWGVVTAVIRKLI
ncbi:MAG: LexA family protein [Desulfonatronovibrio sp.]